MVTLPQVDLPLPLVVELSAESKEKSSESKRSPSASLEEERARRWRSAASIEPEEDHGETPEGGECNGGLGGSLVTIANQAKCKGTIAYETNFNSNCFLPSQG